MSTTTHYVRPSVVGAAQKLGADTRVYRYSHAIRESASVTLCGRFSRAQLGEGPSALPASCPACAKALEGGQ